jgi:hypothetical protein
VVALVPQPPSAAPTVRAAAAAATKVMLVRVAMGVNCAHKAQRVKKPPSARGNWPGDESTE